MAKRNTPEIFKILGTIGTSLYVYAAINKVTAIFVAHNNTAQYEYYSSLAGWQYTVAHDTLNVDW